MLVKLRKCILTARYHELLFKGYSGVGEDSLCHLDFSCNAKYFSYRYRLVIVKGQLRNTL